MVEEAVVLVEIDQQDRARPDLGVGGQGVDHLGRIVRALGRAGRAGVFRAAGGGDDIGDLGETSGQDIGLQPVQRPRGQAALDQGRVGPRRPGHRQSMPAACSRST